MILFLGGETLFEKYEEKPFPSKIVIPILKNAIVNN